ncbi:MAG: murein biosynthesis integral membrane protein MurJ [Planctomycetota bacterium]|jgi:putative peptidoglycan lipid II flippase
MTEHSRQAETRSLLRAAGSISGVTMLSRVLGLLRDMLTSYALGVSWASGTFVLAWMLPNLLRRLFGEGALSAAFIPAYAKKLIAGDRDGARSLLAGVSGGLLVFLSGLVLLVLLLTFFMPVEAWGLAGEDVSSSERGSLMSELLAILFPYVIPVCLLAVYAGALNSLGVFAIPAAAPILLNLFWIGGLSLALWQGGGDLALMTRIIAFCLLGGGLAQLLLAVFPLLRRGQFSAPRLPTKGGPEWAVFRSMGPAILGLSLVQLNLLLDQALAEYLVGAGASFHVFLSNRLLLLPHALVALPIAVAVFPRLASLAAADTGDELRAMLGRALRNTLFLAVPAAGGLMLIAGDLIQVLFVGGEYELSDVPDTRWTTIALVAGLPALGAAQLYVRALYALGEVAAPARIAAWLVLLNLALNLSFVLGLGMGVAGFTLATSCCAFINLYALKRKTDRLRPSKEGLQVGYSMRLSIATLVMLGVVAGTQGLFAAESRLELAAYDLLLPIMAGMLSYGLIHGIMRSPELAPLLRIIRRN